MNGLLSFRKYALHRGVSVEAVSKAVRSGRIVPIVDAQGKRLIDPATADRDWDASRDPAKVRQVVDSPVDARTVAAASVTVNLSSPADPDQPTSERYAKARAEKEEFAARTAELVFLEKSGALVPAAEVASKWSEMAVLVKTKMLGLPSKARQAMPDSVSPELYSLLDRVVREALEELASGDDA